MSMQNQTDQLLRVTIDAGDAINNLSKLQTSIVDVEKEIKNLKADFAAGFKTQTQYANEMSKLTERKSALTNETKVYKQAIQQEYSAQKGLAKNSIAYLRQEVIKLTNEYDRLSASERKNARGTDLRKKIADTRKQIRDLEIETGRFGRNVGNYASAFKNLWKVVGVQLIGGFLGAAQATVAFGNAIKSSIQTSIEFNREISKLSAILSTKPKEIGALTAKAKELGSTTRYTATEVASLQVELAKLGYMENDIVNMSKGVLLFAQATGAELPESAKLAGAALRMFEKDTIHTMEFVDKMSLATSKSALSFDYLQTAMPIVGSVAHTFGFKIEELLGLLGQLANAGFDASMAATATRNIFLNLANANGLLARQIGKPVKNINEMADALIELKNKGIDLNDTLQLTDKRSVAAFNAFLRQAEGAKKLSSELENAKGTAEQMAFTMEDNLGGDITRLKSVWDDFTISLNGSQGPLRTAVSWLSNVVKGMADIVRSATEAIEIAKSNEADIRGGENSETLNMWAWTDRKTTEAYEYQMKKGGLSKKDAELKAYEKRLEEINSDVYDAEMKFKQLEKERKMFEETTAKEYARFNNDDIDKKIEYFQRYVDYYDETLPGHQIAKDKRDLFISMKQKRESEAVAFGILEMQRNRKKLFDEYGSEYTANGLGLSKKDKSNKGAKFYLDAEKELENEILKFYQDSAAKRKVQIETQYDQEIRAIKHKIKEKLKVEKDDTPEITADKAKAAEIYNQLIIMKEEAKKKRLNELDYEEKSTRAKNLNDLYNLQIDAIDRVTNDEVAAIEEEYDLRQKIVKNELDSELALLKVKADNDEEVLKNYKEREEAIKEKYRKKDLENERKHQQELNTIEERRVKQKQVLETDEVENAKLGFDAQRLAYEHTVRENYNSDSEYALAKAEKQKQMLDSYDAYTKAQESVRQKLFETRMNIQTKEDAELLEKLYKYGADEKQISIQKMIDEHEIAEQNAAQQKAILDSMVQYEGESDLDFEKRKTEQETKYANARMEVASLESEVKQQAYENIKSGIDAMAEHSKAFAKASKIIALAEIAINTGKALAAGIAQSQSVPFPANLAAVATTVGVVLGNVASAISTVKSAKFAKGVIDLQGPGTGTSDSISARLSKGESVMTARATQMFKPVLAAMNNIAAQPNATLPTMYTQYNPAQTMANNEGFGNTMKEVMQDVHPVVAVKEINDVSTRMSRIQVLDNI